MSEEKRRRKQNGNRKKQNTTKHWLIHHHHMMEGATRGKVDEVRRNLAEEWNKTQKDRPFDVRI
eukprot:5249750-Ditylum_brightwellii.AAC.1